MGILGKLFGTDKAVNDLVDKDNGLIVQAGRAIGNLHYSDQEKAQDSQETRNWAIRALDALAPFKVVQRILAFSIMFVWAMGAFNGFAAIWYDILNACPAPPIEKAVKAVACVEPGAWKMVSAFLFSDYIFWPTITAVGFYLAGGVLPQWGRK
jgi:hypothetical protein